MPLASELVDTCSVAALISSVSACVTLRAGICESLTRTVNDAVPPAVGVPDMTPAVLSDSPAGRLPALTDQLYDATPPLATNVAL